jgi:hypothetical protein
VPNVVIGFEIFFRIQFKELNSDLINVHINVPNRIHLHVHQLNEYRDQKIIVGYQHCTVVEEFVAPVATTLS